MSALRKEGLSFAEFVEVAAGELNWTKADTKRYFLAFANTILKFTKKYSSVSIPGFGKFRIQVKPERGAFNPKTQEKITVPARKVFKFVQSKAIKESLKGKK